LQWSVTYQQINEKSHERISNLVRIDNQVVFSVRYEFY
jgi:hypothetical protein